jgi:hypothetical protein
MDGLLQATGWLYPGEHDALCRTSHDALDAVIAALTARAAARGMTTRPDEDQESAARSEGWIALPEASLGLLA